MYSLLISDEIPLVRKYAAISLKVNEILLAVR